MSETGELTASERAELEALRERVAALEAEHAAAIAKVHAALAAAQERMYWMDRANLDLNRILGSPGGQAFWQVARRLRRVGWAGRRGVRRVKRWLRIG